MASLNETLIRCAFHRPSSYLLAQQSSPLEVKQLRLQKAALIWDSTPKLHCRASASFHRSPLESQLSSRHSPAHKRPLSSPTRVASSPAAEGATEAPPGRAEPLHSAELTAVLDTLKWDRAGLVVAIAQHANTGAILMQGFADRDAVSATLAAGRATFFSRSRQCLWTKGETSRNFIHVTGVYLDCDKDSIIYLGLPEGPTCHTGADTCYYTRLDAHTPEEGVTLDGVADVLRKRFQKSGIEEKASRKAM